MVFAHASCPQAGDTAARRASPSRVRDWVESQASVTRIWLDQLIAEGDPEDLVSLVHRQAAWLDLMRERLSDAGGEYPAERAGNIRSA